MTVRELTLLLLDEYENSGKYVNLSLSSHRTDSLSSSDRAFLTALLYTTVEHKLTYDYYISSLAKRSTDKIDSHTLNILRLGMCQLLDLSSVPPYAVVNETVKLARNKGERGFVNGILRAAERAKEQGGLPLPDRSKNPARYLSIAYSFPLWLTKHFISLFGEEKTEELFRVFNSEQPTDLTVNTLKISRDNYIKLLSECGIEARPSVNSSLSVRLSGSVNPRALPGYDEGFFFVQDESCAISVEALGTVRGDKIIDVCACPGGKSFASAILSGDCGNVVSFDLHDSKLSLITDGALRLGLSSVKAGKRDATLPDESAFDSFDRVICDVPCSGLGVLGKKPDMRYRAEDSLSSLPDLQYSILEASSKYLRSGGTMIYSTCTLNPYENEHVVSRFLSEHDGFKLLDFTVGELSSDNGMLTLIPNRDKTDGFFMAKIIKE